jgi:hypothetical protein
MSGISKLSFMLTKFNLCVKNTNSLLFKSNSKSLVFFQTRESHGRTMFIRPGKFYTKKYFDMLVFFMFFH